MDGIKWLCYIIGTRTCHARETSGPRQVFFLYRGEIMFIYEGLENCKKISRIKVAKKLDYTYFKRSSDVNETMKPPK